MLTHTLTYTHAPSHPLKLTLTHTHAHTHTRAQVHFMNIANIHSVRMSHDKLRSLANATKIDDWKWLSLVEETKWLVHIRSILQVK